MLHRLEYQRRQRASEYRRSVLWPIMVSAVLYWCMIWGLVSILSKQRFVEPYDSVGLWLACTTAALVVAGIIDKLMKWGWKCSKGVIFAFLMTTGLCGLLASVCGNPFKPFLL